MSAAEQFRRDPKATSSSSYQEEHAEDRLEQGHYFGARVSTSEGTAVPTGRHSVVTRALKPVEPQTFTPALSNRQKRMVKKK